MVDHDCEIAPWNHQYDEHEFNQLFVPLDLSDNTRSSIQPNLNHILHPVIISIKIAVKNICSSTLITITSTPLSLILLNQPLFKLYLQILFIISTKTTSKRIIITTIERTRRRRTVLLVLIANDRCLLAKLKTVNKLVVLEGAIHIIKRTVDIWIWLITVLEM